MRELDFDDPADREYVVTQCAATLVAVAASSEAGGIVVQVKGVGPAGELRDWLVSVEQIPGEMN